jgi:hypothetical protein
MTYTLWSRGRLLGHSALDYKRFIANHRAGDLIPTDMGERLLPVAAGTSAAVINLGKALRRSQKDGDLEKTLPEYVDYVSAIDEAEAMVLELRGPDGEVIPTDWIGVRDVVFLTSLARESEAGLGFVDDAAEASAPGDDEDDPFEDEVDEDGWDTPAIPETDAGQPEALFQLHVMLMDDAEIPW